jgi:modulator of FtsH protease HflC
VVGEPITTAGLKFKLPFIDVANYLPKQILEWDDAKTLEMPTKEKTFISVDTFARWRIIDPKVYIKSYTDERRALTRLDGVIGSETRNVIAKHELIETIRTSKDRKPEISSDLAGADSTGAIGHLPPIKKGRALLEKEILEASKPELAKYGIELLDVRFKRINYNRDVQPRIFERMISERSQIAERFRSEGAGEAAKILGSMEKDLAEIESGAYKESETIKGAADAKATEIYAKAYGTSPEAAEFYEFVRTMGIYEKMLGGQSTVVMSTDSDLFKYLKSVSEKAPAAAAAKENSNKIIAPQDSGLPSRN